ncbi:hypothetical protein LCGC14_0343230 [marine sediment metagenome]|uniref:Uncharacterized protein n=1 Tax=marine sediment metagenome TaxID=412755 RepID=A0A0F9TCX1_9ZZZZ
MATLKVSYHPVDTEVNSNFSARRWRGQTFITPSAFTCTSVKLKMGSTGAKSGDVYLQAVDGSSLPTGSILATVAFDSIDFTGTQALYEFTFVTPVALTNATEYAIVMKSDTATTGLRIYADISTRYPDGIALDSTNGTSWAETTGLDNYFEVYGVTTADFIPSDKKYTRKLVTFSANKIFTGSTPATMTELAAAADDFDTGNPLQATEAYGKVFVANDTDLKVADFVNIKLTTTSLGSSANAPNHSTILTGGSSGAKMVCDYITANTGATTLYGNSITTATFTSGETVTGTNVAGNAVSFTLSANEVSGPHWYDWTVYANDTATYGTMPTTANIIELHIGCLWLMGDTTLPHQWYKTRQNNPWDFLYAKDDAGSAVAGNNTDAGEVGDIIIDAISYSDDFMVFGCAGSLHVMSGNPAAGGRIDLLRNTGLVAPKAWTWDDEGNLYMLSTEGLLRIAKGFGEAENITKLTYPDFIEDLAVDPSLHRLSMAYDSANFGILIAKTTFSDGTNIAWWFDTRSGGLFKEVYPEEASIFSMWKFVADDPSNSALILGCNDGYTREHLKSAKSDDIGGSDELIDSYVTFGPIATSNSVRKAGRVSNMDLFAGGADDGASDDSDPVYVETYESENPQSLIKKIIAGTAYKFRKIFKVSGHKKGNVDRRKVRARWVGFKMGNKTAGESFSLERFDAEGI